MTTGTTLDACGCCARQPCACTPAASTAANRPGLPAIHYRLGTHATFLRTLTDRLSGYEVSDDTGAVFRPLAALTARGSDDPSLALLDSFAVVCDVLTFYQERIANEGYLRTATERRSVLELAREIGYELNPGAAAETYVAFTVDDAPSAPRRATVAAGTKIQSVPGPGEQPQIFETVTASTVRAEWNALAPLQTQVQRLEIRSNRLEVDGHATDRVYLAGTGLNLKAGDPLLVVQGGHALPVMIRTATDDGANARTKVELESPLALGRSGADGEHAERTVQPLPAGVVSQQPVAQTLANVTTFIVERAWDEVDLQAFLAVQKWDGATLLTQVQTLLAADLPDAKVYSFRQRVGFFGASAPAYATLPIFGTDTQPRGFPKDWDHPPISIWRDGTTDISPRPTRRTDRTGKPVDREVIVADDHLSETAGHDAFLDQEVQELTRGSWAVFQGPSGYHSYAIEAVSSGSRADFALSAKTSGLDVASLVPRSATAASARSLDGVALHDPPDKPEALALRNTVAFVLARLQALAPLPYVAPIQGTVTDAAGRPRTIGASAITLDRMVLGLTVGQPIMVSGIEAGDPATPSTGVARWEVAIVKRIVHAAGRTTLQFAQALTYRYLRAGCTISANVILASHGETVAAEVLGSGDGAQANQSFVLRKKPLTYTPASNARGAESTLDVKVNGISWTEVPSLFEQSPRSQSYVVRQGDDGSTTVEFGDAIHGARLPSGQENVVASYRTGIGPAGNVRARTLSLLLNPALGVRSAVNPIAASGGAAPEQLADARLNAPLTVLTLDRIVSLRDFEDFARGFAGIGKASAQAIWSGERRIVFLSVTDASGKPLDPALPLHGNLLTALQTLSDGTDEIQVGGTDPTSGTLRTFIERRFRIAAELQVDPAFDSSLVIDQVNDALTTAFGFAARELGQHVTEAEVILAIQRVAGVVFTRLRRLGDTDSPALPDGGVLLAAGAGWAIAAGTPWIRPAELLLVSATGIALTEIES